MKRFLRAAVLLALLCTLIGSASADEIVWTGPLTLYCTTKTFSESAVFTMDSYVYTTENGSITVPCNEYNKSTTFPSSGNILVNYPSVTTLYAYAQQSYVYTALRLGTSEEQITNNSSWERTAADITRYYTHTEAQRNVTLSAPYVPVGTYTYDFVCVQYGYCSDRWGNVYNSSDPTTGWYQVDKSKVQTVSTVKPLTYWVWSGPYYIEDLVLKNVTTNGFTLQASRAVEINGGSYKGAPA